MRKLPIALLFIASSFTLAQSAPPTSQGSTTQAKSTQKQPSKDDPQGYSKDMFEDGSKIKAELGHPPTYTPPSGAAVKKMPDDIRDIVKAQFGPDFTVAAEKSNGLKYLKPQADTWVPFLVADLDGDGVEDAIIVTRCAKPMSKSVDFNYTVVDPYYTANGFGDPKITATMNNDDPNQNFVVLIIHGAGPEAWRSSKPKSKFVVVNLPFDSLAITHVVIKKKGPPATALGLDEVESSGSVIFWDGKKYKWRDLGGANLN
jgi:hypothetical protein